MVDINNLFREKEFYDLVDTKAVERALPIGYNDYDFLKTVQIELLQLQGHQLFIKNLFNPHTPYKRLLLYHSTGTGKTIVILSVAELYINYFKKMKQQPNFIIIGFTEDIIIRELLKYTEFGYITENEKEELNLLKYSLHEKDIARRRGLKSVLKRRITDKTRGGYYKFYGYQKFANDIFIITVKGLEEKTSHNYLYEEESKFYSRVEEEIKKGNVEVNRSLIESLKYGFIACDEIHNVYNAQSKNNRGMAIEYVLRLLESEDPLTAPKVMYASATPLTSSPEEIVELMDLLIPGKSFKRADFFDNKGNIRPNSLERIGKICEGYVSFLKDTDVTQYPERIIEGETIKGIDYLKFTECPMSTLLENTLKQVKDTEDINTLLSTGNYTLYDIAFPNPDNTRVGLYNSNKIVGIIANASEKWKNDVGIHIEGTNIITGDFLSYRNIGKYSEKYKTLLDELFGLLDSREIGKVIIYHYFVGTSGVLLINELLLQNGFLDAKSVPLSNTRCSICGIELQSHKKEDHQFKPVRVLIAYGEIGSELDKTLSLFNDKRNIYGEEYKILIGSRVIHEGIDFNCIRFMYILSLPRDISTLIQVFGRAIRRKSHLLLPEKYRNVYIRILISVFKDHRISPEVLNYKRKMNIYLKIQLIERELRRYAIDNFINYSKMDLPDKPTLDGLPYTPTIQFRMPKPKPFDELTTFSAFDYSLIEEQTIVKIVKKLFTYRAVWTEKDLWYEIQHPFTEIKTPYDHSTFAKENFYLALDFLVNSTYIENLNSLTLNQDVYSPYISIGNEGRRVVYQDPYYILCPTDEFGLPIIDYDSYMRLDLTNIDTAISITQYINTEIGEKNFNSILNNYLNNYTKKPLMAIAELHPNFHYTVCKKYIEGYDIKGTEALIDLYDELEALIYYDSFLSNEVAKTFGIKEHRKVIGFKAQNISFIYVNSTWEQITTTLLRVKQYDEQEWVGFSKVTSGSVDFKIRPGLGYLKATTDRRKIDRGRTCITLPSNSLNKIAKFLNIYVKKTKQACIIILKKMLELQMNELQKSKGKRYYFFYFSIIPNL